MIFDFLTYLKQLCIEHVEFNHGEENRAYFEFDYKSMTDAKHRNRYVLYVDRLQGKILDNQGDYTADTAFVTALFLQKMSVKDLTLAREVYAKCKQHLDAFIARMQHDRRHGGPELCKMLRHLRRDEITWEFAPINADLWAGVQVRLPFTAERAEAYAPEDWNTTP